VYKRHKQNMTQTMTSTERKNRTMLTDLYQLTMNAGYFASGKNDRATFDLFIRKLPKDWGFYIANGIEDAIDYATSVSFDEADIQYLREQDIFGEDRVGLLHGRMNSVEKEKAMANFKSREIDVLLATPVVEVGVDVPSATIMVIEGAERYGLAQLHQLRGRVGRGVKQSYCLLFTSGTEAKATERLNYFASNSSGFRLAEYDLMHRGTGELYGTKQHGASDLVMASLSNRELVETTRKCSDDFMNTFQLSEFASLETRIKKLQLTQIAKD